ncbi:MAG: peptidyl-prolyl cis-trans isomerase, partial [Neisseriaceae bacterium]|nr:peptidyl-prolyl cis-trans isomerase [Neisseriaceae bacterium]
MFDAVRKFNTPAKVLVGLVALSFVGFGATTLTGGEPYIAKVGGEIITEGDVSQALKAQGAENTPELRDGVYANLLRRAYLLVGAENMGVAVSIEQIKQIIVKEQSFQDENGFNESLYQDYLQAQGMTETQLIEQLRKEFSVNSVLSMVQAGQIVSDAQVQQEASIWNARYTLRTAMIDPRAFAAEVAVDDAKLNAYYTEHKAEYVLPLAVKLSSVVLTTDAVKSKVTVNDEEVKKYYDEHVKQMAPPERKVSHILLAFADDTPAAKADAKKKAEGVLQEAKANPSQFAALAQKYSEDPGSAADGGNLDFMAQNGMMVKPFEDAAFALAKGQVSDLVETQFGYHILLVTDIKPAPTFESMKADLTKQLTAEKAQKLVHAEREQLSELAFNNSTDLKPVADKLGLTLNVDKDWLSEADAKAQGMPEALVKAIFSDEVVKQKFNSEPIDLPDGSVLVVRANEVRPKTEQTLAQVKDQVRAAYVMQEADKLAKAKAADVTKRLQKGEAVTLNWMPAEEVSGGDIQKQFPTEAAQQMLKIRGELAQPAYVNLNMGNQYLVLKVEGVR